MEPINKTELENETLPIRKQAEVMEVKTDSDNIAAANFLMTIKGMIKKVKEKFAPAKESAWKAHKEITGLETEILRPLEQAENGLKQKMIAFEREAEKERQRLQAIQEAEARQIEAEAQKAAEQAAKLAEKGKDGKAEVKQQVAETLQVKADEIRQVVIEKPMTRNAGISYVTTWKYEIVNPETVPANYMMIDEKKIGQVVKATRGTLAIPGVRIYSEKQIASKSY
jgi:aminopeptidase N